MICQTVPSNTYNVVKTAVLSYYRVKIWSYSASSSRTSLAAPMIWNSLPEHTRNFSSSAISRKQFKTHFSPPWNYLYSCTSDGFTGFLFGLIWIWSIWIDLNLINLDWFEFDQFGLIWIWSIWIDLNLINLDWFEFDQFGLIWIWIDFGYCWMQHRAQNGGLGLMLCTDNNVMMHLLWSETDRNVFLLLCESPTTQLPLRVKQDTIMNLHIFRWLLDWQSVELLVERCLSCVCNVTCCGNNISTSTSEACQRFDSNVLLEHTLFIRKDSNVLLEHS